MSRITVNLPSDINDRIHKWFCEVTEEGLHVSDEYPYCIGYGDYLGDIDEVLDLFQAMGSLLDETIGIYPHKYRSREEGGWWVIKVRTLHMEEDYVGDTLQEAVCVTWWHLFGEGIHYGSE